MRDRETGRRDGPSPFKRRISPPKADREECLNACLDAVKHLDDAWALAPTDDDTRQEVKAVQGQLRSVIEKLLDHEETPGDGGVDGDE